ncbi:MAG: hypothetical protein U9R05_00940, partial [Chloroflexota bacterium]|nr:hypothetical protein [Chloroflexota bacterium]
TAAHRQPLDATTQSPIILPRRLSMSGSLPGWRAAGTSHRDIREAHISHPRIKHKYTNDVAAHLCIRGKFVDGGQY